MTIYRGFDIITADNRTFYWIDDNGAEHDGFDTEELAMNSIDAFKREQREKAA